MTENKKSKQYFIHKGVKIIITEHFSENGKDFKNVIKEAIIRDVRAVTKAQDTAKN